VRVERRALRRNSVNPCHSVNSVVEKMLVIPGVVIMSFVFKKKLSSLNNFPIFTFYKL